MTHTRIPVTERSQVSALRYAVLALADEAHLSEPAQHRAALVATELGANLVKHTSSGGDVLIRAADGDGPGSVELLAIDRGPGMDVERCLADGFSSAGSPGTGLGAVRRLSTEFDAQSNSSGTVVRAVVADARPAGGPARPGLVFGGV